MQEIWKDIPGYEGLYQASSLGNIKSYDKEAKTKNQYGAESTRIRKGKMLTQTGKRYSKVALYDSNNKKKFYSVHRLVALTFIPNPHNLPQVNHKNEDIHNNCVDNLEWCTSLYNCNYGTRNSKIYNRTTFRKGHIPHNKKLP